MVPAGQAATSGRWIPTRAGILNVWRYYDEVFEFENGRLLLRGPNGSGKSKALELLMPFLFDASLRPHRLSTFGTGDRTMQWNLMGEGTSGTTRVGYVWMEFARVDAVGTSWLTIGARLQASQHTRTPTAHYFHTSRRVQHPQGLPLVNDTGQPWTRADLSDLIGTDGLVHETASDYRQAVRTALFPGMSEQRYDSLITAMLQLRQPKLSQRLDPSVVSDLISAALPPVGDAEIQELAEGFERLDRQREQLQRRDDEAAAAARLAGQQRGYAQRVLRLAAGRLTSATSEMDRLTRQARQSQEQYAAARGEREQLHARRHELHSAAARSSAAITTLERSDEYKVGEELVRLGDQARESERRAAERERAAAQAERAEAEDRRAHEEQSSRLEEATAAERTLSGRAYQAAEHARMGSVHEEVGSTDPVDGDRQRNLLRAAVSSRRGQIEQVRVALAAADEARIRAEAAEDEREVAREHLGDAVELREEARVRTEEELESLTSALLDWAQHLVELRIDDVGAMVSGLGQGPGDEEVVRGRLEQARRVAREAITEDLTVQTHRRQGMQERLAGLEDDLLQLRQSRDLPPPPPRTRVAERDPALGAPLWRLVSFIDGPDERGQADLEAALEASGMLDAWVAADGSLTVLSPGPDEHAPLLDTVLDGRFPAAPDRSLLEVLRAEPEARVPTEVVDRLLSSVAWGPNLPGEHPAAVGQDGTWRLGTAVGRWTKPAAEYIGATARERARQQRIAELEEVVTACRQEIAGVTAEIEALHGRLDDAEAEMAAAPPFSGLRAARQEYARRDQAVADRESRLGDATTQVQHWEHTMATQRRTVTQKAAEHHLPAQEAALQRVGQAVDVLDEAGQRWIDARLAMAHAQTAADRALAARTRSADAARRERREAAEAAGVAESTEAARAALEATSGMAHREILQTLGRHKDELRASQDELESTSASIEELAGAIGRLEEKQQGDAARRDESVEHRDAAASRLRHLCDGTFPQDTGLAVTEQRDQVKSTLELGRRITATWPDLAVEPRNLSSALSRLTEAVHDCRSVLATRADLAMEADDDVQVLTATVDGVRVGAGALAHIMQEEADRSRDDITASERELFDKTLTGDLRRRLADRLREATDMIARMNERLAGVRTASNMTVRLKWVVDDELSSTTRDARDLLLKNPVVLTEANRDALHDFFRQRVEEARASGTAASWQQQLAEVFDYTAWHRFQVHIDRGNGQGWKTLTRHLHGALSGGEKAIALHLPLFAAVAAHYQSVPQAPRLILLDEVFVGVDTVNRGQVFGLLASLDLDLVLTSDHEWCTYRELDGVAIHQLISAGSDRGDAEGGDDDEAVTTVRWVWNGEDLFELEAESFMAGSQAT